MWKERKTQEEEREYERKKRRKRKWMHEKKERLWKVRDGEVNWDKDKKQNVERKERRLR